jgi:hypothetical protein
MRFILTMFLLAFGLVLAFVVINEDLADLIDGTGSGSDPVDEPTPTSAPEPTPVTSIDASADRDPRDVLLDLLQDPDAPNLELVYNYLPDRFHVLDFSETWVRFLAPVRESELIDSINSLSIEEFDGYSLIRSNEDWLDRWVFVLEDGEWRLDPGDRLLLMASAQIQQGMASGFSYGMAPPGDYQARSRTDIEDGSIPPLIRGRLQGVGVHESGIDISMVWEHELGMRDVDEDPIDSHLLSDIVIPLDSITWEVDDVSGGVEVLWSDAAVNDREIRLPGWPSEELADEASHGSDTYVMEPYGTTLRLFGVPDDAERILLKFERVLVGPFGDDSPVPDGEIITYTFEFAFPAETTDPVMAGERPEPVGDVDDDSPDATANLLASTVPDVLIEEFERPLHHQFKVISLE